MENNNSPNETERLEGLFRNYAWKYFELHADQRLKAFQFYITLSTAVAGGFALLVKNGADNKALCVFGLALTFLSFVFWKLEERTRELVRIGERALKYLDRQHNLPDMDGKPHPLRMFCCDDFTSSTRPLYPIVNGHFSYSRCFRWVFVLFGLIGIGIAITSLVLF